jgi:hypothetical protein
VLPRVSCEVSTIRMFMVWLLVVDVNRPVV